MRKIWIDEAEGLREFCERFDGGVIAVDTESDHFHAYQASVCLIQVATKDTAALIDPLWLEKEELAPLLEAIEDPSMMKLLHSARNDIMELDRDYGLPIANIYDTQIAALFLGYEKSNLSFLLEDVLDVEPGPKFQRFDWTTRPLPEGPAFYATEDVVHLDNLRTVFDAKLEEAGWTRAFHEQCAHIAVTSQFTAKEFDPEGWRRIKTRHKLDGRDRAALKALFEWRHELCLELNQAALFVMDNSSLVRIARARPTTVAAFKALSIRKSLNRHRLQSLLDTVARSLEATPPPERLPRGPRQTIAADEKARLDALKEWRNRAAVEHSLPREFVATNTTLAEIAASPPSQVGDLEAFGDVLGWHRELFGGEIVRLCGGV